MPESVRKPPPPAKKKVKVLQEPPAIAGDLQRIREQRLAAKSTSAAQNAEAAPEGQTTPSPGAGQGGGDEQSQPSREERIAQLRSARDSLKAAGVTAPLAAVEAELAKLEQPAPP
eukprot:2139119-Alexandrium_andersonii.AAC.1